MLDTEMENVMYITPLNVGYTDGKGAVYWECDVLIIIFQLESLLAPEANQAV